MDLAIGTPIEIAGREGPRGQGLLSRRDRGGSLTGGYGLRRQHWPCVEGIRPGGYVTGLGAGISWVTGGATLVLGVAGKGEACVTGLVAGIRAVTGGDASVTGLVAWEASDRAS